MTNDKHAPTDQAAPERCAGCGQPTFGKCWTDCGMSLCGAPLCGDCRHIDEKYGWRHGPRADLAAPSAQQEQDHRSFPDAADGRPMPPMGDELMTAGLNGDDARFVAIQLAQNGLRLTPAPSAPAEVEGLVERAIVLAGQDYKPAQGYSRTLLECTTALTALQAENERIKAEWAADLVARGKRHREACRRAEKAEAERDALAVAVREIKVAWDWWREDSYDRCSSVVEDAISDANAKLKGEV